MERKTGLAVAGAISMVLVAGGLAVGANLGLLDSGRSAGPAGRLRPSDLSPSVVTVEVTEPAVPVGSAVDDSASSVEVVEIPVPSGPTQQVQHDSSDDEAESEEHEDEAGSEDSEHEDPGDGSEDDD